MAAREIEMPSALRQISQLSNEQLLMSVVIAGGAVGICLSKLRSEIRTLLLADLEECLQKNCDHMDAVGKLSLTVTLNTSDNPLYLQELVEAMRTHISLH